MLTPETKSLLPLMLSNVSSAVVSWVAASRPAHLAIAVASGKTDKAKSSLLRTPGVIVTPEFNQSKT